MTFALVTKDMAPSTAPRSLPAALSALVVCAGLVGFAAPAKAAAAKVDAQRFTLSDEFSSVHRGGGGARAHAGGHARSARVNRPGVNRPANVHRPVNRPSDVHRPGGGNIVVNRPVRGWTNRPYFGTVVGGIALGSVIAATTAGVVPAAPGPNMCWYWTDSARINGYWDYCQPPY